MFRYVFILTCALALFWLGMSGYFKPMLLTLGGISIATVVFMTARMKIFDGETVPYLYIPKTLVYFTWLGGEIFKANIAVLRAVLRPDMAISPTMVRIPLRKHSDMGAAMFANSITLTPGTVSVEMDDDTILVHALVSEMANPDDFMEMSEQAGWAIGDAPAATRLAGERI
ncbi:Na+/H+ antiporter subunit E [Fretibacter rubidus]|uniref:Na+/H+ antiporter subunit E n=1 Tax=Fretibacter rubidus TaxID=570162 RepID=UPI00352B8B96